MGYSQQFALVDDVNFRGRVAMALVFMSEYVVLENTGTAFHAERLLFAQHILRAPKDYVQTFIFTVAGQTVIAAAGPIFSLDSDIDYIVGTIFQQKAIEFVPSV